MIKRYLYDECIKLLRAFPALGLLGPRQVGKTTLAQLIAQSTQDSIYLDLESPSDLDKLINAETFFTQFKHRLIVIDEIQRNPELFPVLRSVIDKHKIPGRFIILGSASPDLIRSSSESLAGRIAYLELGTFNMSEIDAKSEINKLWLSGGYPDAFLYPERSNYWLENYIRNYVERDLPLLGLSATPILTRRLWTMLAHLQGQTVNYTAISKSLGVSNQKVKSFIDFFEQAYLVRVLPPYFINTKKRLIKSPKIYLRDTGILHHLLNIHTETDLFGHPILGASWEGFVVEQIIQHKSAEHILNYYRTQDGAELDLIIEKNGVAVAGVDIKFGDRSLPTRGNTESANELKLAKRYVVKQSGDEWVTNNGFIVTNVQRFINNHLPEI